MLQHTVDAYNRAVGASTAILAQDGNQRDHDERVSAIEAILYGQGLDTGQVAHGPTHGDPNWSFRPPPPPAAKLSPPALAFLKRQKLA